MPRRVLLACVLAAALLSTTLQTCDEAWAQGAFRVTYNLDRTGPSHVELSGTVFNDTSTDAIDVYVTAQALDQAGRRVAQGVSWVGGVSHNASAGFTAKIPVVRGATSYRVAVTSFRFVTVSQAP